MEESPAIPGLDGHFTNTDGSDTEPRGINYARGGPETTSIDVALHKQVKIPVHLCQDRVSSHEFVPNNQNSVSTMHSETPCKFFANPGSPGEKTSHECTQYTFIWLPKIIPTVSTRIISPISRLNWLGGGTGEVFHQKSRSHWFQNHKIKFTISLLTGIALLCLSNPALPPRQEQMLQSNFISGGHTKSCSRYARPTRSKQSKDIRPGKSNCAPPFAHWMLLTHSSSQPEA